MSSRTLALLFLSVACLLGGCAEPQDFPSRPITLICPWSPGGGTDQVSRQMAFFLEHELGVPCTVINATGGQGVTGHSRGLKATPDGYTIGVITFELNTLHWQGLTSLTYRDAIPLISVNEDAAAIWVPKDAPWKTLKDLERDVRNNPGTIKGSGTATGAAWHLALAGWLQSAGLSPDAITWIPMGGADPSIQELFSGGVDLVCCSLPEAKLHYERGDLRALGVMSEETVEGFEEIPTTLAAGYDWTLVGWRGFAVAPGTPDDRVATLTAAMKKIVTGEVSVDGKTFPQFMQQRGFNNRWRERGEFLEFLAENDEKFGTLLAADAFKQLAEGEIGPYDFPIVLGVGLSLFAVLLAIEVLFKRGDRSEPDLQETSPEAVVETTTSARIINVALALAGIVAYLTLTETVGFVLTASAILLILLLRTGTRPLTAFAITVILVPGV
ncbi:MAG TPA: tripartite tricarboxylate transporter substrate-binding protein, partial [Planctomycetaceae bacterium]|nr:tripartite tricarboxylate transporter substrate-binding protein [Planctomycetaceae bacterium]